MSVSRIVENSLSACVGFVFGAVCGIALTGLAVTLWQEGRRRQ